MRSWEFFRSYYKRAVGITYGGPNFSLRQLIGWLILGLSGIMVYCKLPRSEKKGGILSFKSFTPLFLEKHLAYIHSKSDDIWVDTFSNVFEYLRLSEQTKIEIKGLSDGSADFVLHGRNQKPNCHDR